MQKCLIVLVFFGLSSTLVHAQETRHYVVVGAFADKENAARLAARLGSEFNPRYELNSQKNLYYVYVFESENPELAHANRMRVRAETPYKKAWVFHGNLGTGQVVTTPRKQEIREQPKPVVKDPEPETVAVVETKQEPPPVVTQPEVTKPEVREDPVTTPPPGKAFFFKLVNEQTGNPVEGEVQVLESAKASEYIAFESNKVVYLPAPKNKNGTYQLRTIAPGYKSAKRALSYSDPANSAASQGSQKEYVIAMPLVRVKTGDYIEFNNVRFYANTTILQPESRRELAELVALMKENSHYKVVIHGHCNGNDDRDITVLGTSTDLFATSSQNSREHADPIHFTLLRAETVKAYLIQEGIDAGRIKTKGQGGKEFIYPMNSTLSARNDRVEVEVKKK
jgi:outer membrane protein OmpA-like peptidoglycan-associated protein